jgi:hypothetical protein
MPYPSSLLIIPHPHPSTQMPLDGSLNISDQELSRLPTCCPYMSKLKLCGLAGLSGSAVVRLCQAWNLEELLFDDCPWDDGELAKCLEILSSSKHSSSAAGPDRGLNALSLMNAENVTLAGLVRALAHAPRLRSLYIDYIQLATGSPAHEDSTALQEILSALPALTSIDISGMHAPSLVARSASLIEFDASNLDYYNSFGVCSLECPSLLQLDLGVCPELKSIFLSSAKLKHFRVWARILQPSEVLKLGVFFLSMT